MKIIIEGKNRTEFCTPKTKDMDRRRFFETRGMLYRAYPEQMSRMRIFEYGKERGTDTVIVYQENAIRPMVHIGDKITVDKLLADIDENKIMTSGIVNKKAWGSLSSKRRSNILNAIPFVIMGAILLYALWENGFSI